MYAHQLKKIGIPFDNDFFFFLLSRQKKKTRIDDTFKRCFTQNIKNCSGGIQCTPNITMHYGLKGKVVRKIFDGSH